MISKHSIFWENQGNWTEKISNDFRTWCSTGHPEARKTAPHWHSTCAILCFATILAKKLPATVDMSQQPNQSSVQENSPRLIPQRMRSSQTDLRGGIVRHSPSVAAHLASSSA